MEEKILEIVQKYEKMAFSRPSECAKEITAHVMKFIEWTHHGSHPFVPWQDIEDGKLIKYFTDEVDPKRYSLEDLYQYWLDNARKDL